MIEARLLDIIRLNRVVEHVDLVAVVVHRTTLGKLLKAAVQVSRLRQALLVDHPRAESVRDAVDVLVRVEELFWPPPVNDYVQWPIHGHVIVDRDVTGQELEVDVLPSDARFLTFLL